MQKNCIIQNLIMDIQKQEADSGKELFDISNSSYKAEANNWIEIFRNTFGMILFQFLGSMEVHHAAGSSQLQGSFRALSTVSVKFLIFYPCSCFL